MVWFTFPLEVKPPEKKKLSDKIKEKEIAEKKKQEELRKVRTILLVVYLLNNEWNPFSPDTHFFCIFQTVYNLCFWNLWIETRISDKWESITRRAYSREASTEKVAGGGRLGIGPWGFW